MGQGNEPWHLLEPNKLQHGRCRRPSRSAPFLDVTATQMIQVSTTVNDRTFPWHRFGKAATVKPGESWTASVTFSVVDVNK